MSLIINFRCSTWWLTWWAVTWAESDALWKSKLKCLPAVQLGLEASRPDKWSMLLNVIGLPNWCPPTVSTLLAADSTDTVPQQKKHVLRFSVAKSPWADSSEKQKSCATTTIKWHQHTEAGTLVLRAGETGSVVDDCRLTEDGSVLTVKPIGGDSAPLSSL